MWVSPDGKIKKCVVIAGDWCKKPSENTECKISLTDCPESLLEYNNACFVIGNSNSNFERTLDICLCTMNENEVAKFKLSENISFMVKLLRIQFNGYIYQWDAQKKIKITQSHKDAGVALYKQNRYKDAAYRFVKGLKILSSIPIDAEQPPEGIDGVLVKDIYALKANLYGNLASYYLKNESWLHTINACKKVIDYDQNNVKAHYKLAVAYMKDRNFEQAQKALTIVLEFEPNNRAALEIMKNVKTEIRKANLMFDSLVKKMFK